MIKEKKYCDFGFILIKEAQVVEDLTTGYYEVIQQKAVENLGVNSAKKVYTNTSMECHTDHFSVDVISLFCEKEASLGGQTILIDLKYVHKEFSPSELKTLQEVRVKNVDVFNENIEYFPLVQDMGERFEYYYAPWLADANNQKSKEISSVLLKFKEVIRSQTPKSLLLKKNELLIIDNKRILHGRAAFEGQRRLIRTWYKKIN